MSSSRWFSPAWSLTLVGTAAFLAASVANAQVVPASSSLHAAPVSATESSSTEWAFSTGSGTDALPAAPEPSNGAGGQYDNKSGGGSSGWKGRLALEFGGGFDMPVSDTTDYSNNGFGLIIGGGLHFTHGLSALIEWQFFDNGLPSAIAANAGVNGGNIHLNGITFNPVVDLMPHHNTGVYVTGGGGYYHKSINFQVPQGTSICYYFYCGYGYQNQTVGSLTSNSGGFDIGGGVSHRFAGMYGDGKMAIFAEARYLDVLSPAFNHQSAGGAIAPTSIGSGTKLVPITFGLRF